MAKYKIIISDVNKENHMTTDDEEEVKNWLWRMVKWWSKDGGAVMHPLPIMQIEYVTKIKE